MRNGISLYGERQITLSVINGYSEMMHGVMKIINENNGVIMAISASEIMSANGGYEMARRKLHRQS